MDLDGDDFISKEALLSQKQKGIERKLIGFEMIDESAQNRVSDNEG